MIKYSIIISTYNHLEDCLKPCIESLIKYTNFTDEKELIISANGCTDGTKEYLDALNIKNLKVVWNDDPIGPTKAFNSGVEESNGEYIIYLNNDVELLKQNKDEWIHRLESKFKEDENIQIVGNEEHVFGIYHCKPILKYLPFYFVMIKRTAIEQYGFLDPIFSKICAFDDIEWCLRIQLLNKNNRIEVIDNKIYHKGNCTINDISTVSKIEDGSWATKYILNKFKDYYEPCEIKNSIIIPTYNNTDGFFKCLDSIIKNTDLSETEIIFVCNGCDKSIADQLFNIQIVPYKEILFYNKPIGYTKAINEGLKKAKGKNIVLLNDDVIILDYWEKNKWIDTLTEPLNKNKVGITGVHSLLLEHTNEEFILFYCACISRKCFEEVGFLDETFNPGYGEDIDYSIRAKQKGYKIEVVNDFISGSEAYIGTFPIYHKAESTVHTLDNWSDIKLKNITYLLDKYNIEPFYDKNISIFIPSCTVGNINTVLNSMVKNTSPELMNRFNFIFHCNGKDCELIENTIKNEFSYLSINSILCVDNTYHSRAINQCLDLEKKLFNNEYVISLNDDIVLLDSKEKNAWFYLLFNPFLYNKDIAIVGTESPYIPCLDIKIIPFHCCMIRKKYFYNLNEDYLKFNSYCDDLDWCYRVQRDGKLIIKTPIWEELKWNKNNGMSIGSYPIYHKSNGSNARKEDLVFKGLFYAFSTLKGKSNINYDDKQNNILYNDYLNVMDVEDGSGKHRFNILDMPLEDRSVDCFLLSFINNMYLKEKDIIIKELNRVLKDNAILYIDKTLNNELDENLNEEFKYIDSVEYEDAILCKYIFNEKIEDKKEEELKNGVTAVITTKGRYFTTLPLAIQSIINQTVKPNELIIYDDEFDLNKVDLRKISLYNHLFNMLSINNIPWFVLPGSRKGPAHNHHRSIYDAKYKYIWRIDDDEIAENNALEELIKYIENDEIAAVGSSILQYDSFVSDVPEEKIYNKINLIDIDNNIQWINFKEKAIVEVEHLHSSFLYKTEVAKEIGGYPLNLSEVSHREETIFSNSLIADGKYKLIVNTGSKIWHYRELYGGIRSNNDVNNYEHDQRIFEEFLDKKKLSTVDEKTFLVYLYNGIGDHYAFLHILDDLIQQNKDKDIIISCCYQDIFEDYKDKVKIVDLGYALLKYSKKYLESLSPYTVGWKYLHNENKKIQIVDIYKDIYLKKVS